MAKPRHILIVEDERPLSKALDLKLQAAGFSTTVAYDGEEALALIDKGSFDLILLDLVLPKKDGFEVLKGIHQKGKTPVIVSTNLSQVEDEERVKKLGAVGFFTKADTPITDVINQVKKHLKA